MKSNWYWYWKAKRHVPKGLCEKYPCLDSFAIFKNKDFFSLSVSNNRYSVVVKKQGEHLCAELEDGHYIITVEKQACRFGGWRYFVRCPNQNCNQRLRKLYCHEGYFLCRKCLRLGYYSQRVELADRLVLRQKKLEAVLERAGGSVWEKPKWMHEKTYKNIKAKVVDYELRCWKILEADQSIYFNCMHAFLHMK